LSKLVVRSGKLGYHPLVLDRFVNEEMSAYPEIANLQIESPGGGRISCDSDSKQIKVYGYSNSFGQADH
jgi:hypothetical protein